MPAAISFFDMAVSITPPVGHFEPVPLLLGPNWQPNDIRVLFVSGSGSSSQGTTLMMPMSVDPPTGFTGAYILNEDDETGGVYWRRLQTGDTDTSVVFPKPPGWRHFNWATLTIRGVDPANNPTAGALTVSNTVGDANAVVTSVSVPAAGDMVFCLGTVPDPEGGWPSWAVSMGVPSGWTHLVATDRSGVNFYAYDSSPALMLVGKNYASSGSTGAVSVPCAPGAPAFAAMYMHVRPAPDVSVAIGAA